MNEKNKIKPTVVIVGGGYGGLAVAVGLGKKVAKKEVEAEVVLVDRQYYHLCHPNIYEVATSEEEFVSNEALKNSVAVPFREVLPETVNFIQGDLEKVNQKEKILQVSGKEIAFDYLVLALGSCSDDFGIPGIKENALTLKSLGDALRIRNDMEFVFQSHRTDLNKKQIRIVVGGGGFSGVELCGELLNFIDILCWKYNYPRSKAELLIVEGAPQLLAGLAKNVSDKVYCRLRSMGVEVKLSTVVSEVAPGHFKTKDGEVINHDIFIWTGGVKSVRLPFEQNVDIDRKSRCLVNDKLSLNGSAETIFLLGDDACIMDKEQRALPQTAVQALDQAKYLVYALTEKVRGEKLAPFSPREFSYMIPIRGKWVILHTPNGFTMSGYIPWLIRRYIDFRYYHSLMPFRKALKAVWRERIYTRND